MQRCGPDGASPIEIPSSGRWWRCTARRVNASHFLPGRRLVLLEPFDQRPIDQALVEHNGLVIGTVAHAKDNQDAQPQIAVGRVTAASDSSVKPAIS